MTGKITIQQATRDDAPAVHELHTKSVRQLCRGHYSNKQINGWLNHRTPEGYFPDIDQERLFVAMDGSEIVGFGGAAPGQVRAIYVLPERAKEGIGTTLLKYAMEIAKRGTQKIVLESTLNAADFYRKEGFVQAQKRLIKRGNVELPAVFMEYRVVT